MTNDEILVDEQVSIKPTSGEDADADYDVQTGEPYLITISTTDGLIDDYQWDIPSNAGHRSLDVGIGESEIDFAISTAD